MFRLKDYHFHLPKQLIARFPVEKREESRLMIVNRRSGTVEHARFADFPALLDPGSFLVVNDTRVVPARIFGTIDGKAVEMLIVAWTDENRAEVLAMPAARFRQGKTIFITPGISAAVEGKCEKGRRVVRFSAATPQVMAEGYAPLPPYIKRRFAEASRLRRFDLERYQTVYARHPSSIAAPTAGLHFSSEIMAKVRARCPVLEITLQVGEATFQKLCAADIRNRRMGSETVCIKKKTVQEIERLKQQERKLLAVGTTTVRALESYAALRPDAETFCTQLFIHPGFSFRMVDRLLTNFHLPESSLFILVSAFAGLDLMKEAYRIAIENRYRFFSYGDAMLIV